MNKMKVAVLSVIAALNLSIPNIVFAATDAGYFPNSWYSDSGKIGYFVHNNSSPYTSLKIFYAQTSACTMGSTLVTAADAGFDSWASNLTVTRSVGTSSNYNIMQYGITRSEATAAGMPINVPAATVTWASYTVPYYGTTLDGINKDIAQISKTTIYYIWETSGLNTAGYPINKWKTAACHENGHALGYSGHDTSSTIAIMNPSLITIWDTWGIKTTQYRDRRYINNTYSKF